MQSGFQGLCLGWKNYLGVTLKYDKQDVIDFTETSKLTMCRVSEAGLKNWPCQKSCMKSLVQKFKFSIENWVKNMYKIVDCGQIRTIFKEILITKKLFDKISFNFLIKKTVHNIFIAQKTKTNYTASEALMTWSVLNFL